MKYENKLEVGEDEKGGGEGGEADRVAREVDVGERGGVRHLPYLIIDVIVVMVMVIMGL